MSESGKNDGKSDGGALDKGLKEAFAKPKQGSSIVERLASRQSAPRINLRDIPDETTPVIKPKAKEGASFDSERYQVVGEIARGGVGIVLKGRDMDLGRDVAMKVLLDHHADREELVERFVEEAQVGGQLQHPGIVPVYELGVQDDGRPYFTMKLIKGQTLSAILSKRADHTKERRKYLSIFEQVCHTVAYAHARGVIHRDLKPSNVMVGAFGEVQVVDWGFAKVLGTGGVEDEKRAARKKPDLSVIETIRSGSEGSGSIAGSVMGTPAYMSPEQAMGSIESVDERSDVFSLGAILCEIITGEPPYTGEYVIIQAAEARLDAAHERLDNCEADKELIALAKRCMAPAQAVRPPDAGELATLIGKYLTSVEDRAHEADLRAVRERGKRRLTLAVAATLLLAVMVGGGGKYLFDQERISRIEQADATVNGTLERAAVARGEARSDLALWPAVVEKATRAVAQSAKGSKDAHGRAGAFLEAVRTERKQAEETDARLEALSRRGEDFEKQPRFTFPTGDDPFAKQVTRASDDLDALKALAKSCQGNPKESLALLAEKLGKADDIVGAIEVYRAALNDHPKDYWANFALGWWLGRDEQWPEAAACLSTARVVRPRGVAVRYHLGRALVKKADLDGAINEWRAVLKQNRDYAKVREHLADLLFHRARTILNSNARTSVLLHRELFALDPDENRRMSALHNYGLALMGVRDYRAAVKAYRESIRLGNKDDVIHALLAKALFATGDHAEGLETHREYMRRRPRDHSARVTLADMFMVMERYDDAEAALEPLLNVRPTAKLGVMIYRRVALIHARRNAWPNAVVNALRAVRYYKWDYAAQRILEFTLRRSGNPEAARNAIEAAIPALMEGARWGENRLDRHHFVGVFMGRVLQPDEARKRFESKMRQPTSADRAAFLTGVAAARQDHHSDLDGSIELLFEALHIAPRYYPARARLVNNLSLADRQEEALEIGRPATRWWPKRKNVHHALALLYRDLGDFETRLEGHRRGKAVCPKETCEQCDDLVKRSERLVALDKHLDAIRTGRRRPVGDKEKMEFGLLCYRRGHNAAAFRYFTSVKQVPEPDLVRAALAAVRTETPEGRRRGLKWLQRYVAKYEKLYARAKFRDDGNARGHLATLEYANWFESVRDDAIDKLPADEQEAWRKFWTDLREFLSRLR